MNDPNGLLYYKGQYHLFFQYNPYGQPVGQHVLGPRDQHGPGALERTASRHPADLMPPESIEDIFSGRAVVDKNNTSGFGTRENPPIGRGLHERVHLKNQADPGAVSGLQHRRRHDVDQVRRQPGARHRLRGVPRSEGVLVRPGQAVADGGGPSRLEHKVDIYGSPNLKNWTHLSDFGPAGAVGGVWECPDLFPMAVNGNPRNVKWVMVVNLNPGGIAGGSGGQYFVGDFDGTTFTSDDPASYTPPTGTVLAGLRGPASRPGPRPVTRSVPVRPPATPPARGGVSGYLGSQLANSFHGGDAGTGTLTSPEFTISDGYLNFLVGGGNHPHVAGTTLTQHPAVGHGLRRLRRDTWGTGWTATGDFANAGPGPGTIGDQQPVSGYLGDQAGQHLPRP